MGAPNILCSGNGRDFASSIVAQVEKMWPKCVITHGTSEAQEVVKERLATLVSGWLFGRIFTISNHNNLGYLYSLNYVIEFPLSWPRKLNSRLPKIIFKPSECGNREAAQPGKSVWGGDKDF